jgi:hypothetical protein
LSKKKSVRFNVSKEKLDRDIDRVESRKIRSIERAVRRKDKQAVQSIVLGV